MINSLFLEKGRYEQGECMYKSIASQTGRGNNVLNIINHFNYENEQIVVRILLTWVY